MIESHTGGQFGKLLAALPDDVRREAYKAYRLFRRDPAHPSLHFKEVDSRHGIWSARVTQNYRALGQRHGNQITWIWIGTYREYLSRIGKRYYPQQ